MAQLVKSLPAMQEMWVQSLGRENPLEKKMATQVFLPGESRGQRSLVDCSPRGHKASDMTERLSLSFISFSVGSNVVERVRWGCSEPVQSGLRSFPSCVQESYPFLVKPLVGLS